MGSLGDHVGVRSDHGICSLVTFRNRGVTSQTVWSRYPVFVFTWWVTGTMAIACYTAAFVWTMEIAAGKYKTYISMSMNYSWPLCRLIIAGEDRIPDDFSHN